MDNNDNHIRKWQYNSRHSPFSLFYLMIDKVSAIDSSTLSDKSKKKIFNELSDNDFTPQVRDLYLCLLSEALHINYHPVFTRTFEKINRLKSDGDFELLVSNSASTGLKLNRMETRLVGWIDGAKELDEIGFYEANMVFKDNHKTLKNESNSYNVGLGEIMKSDCEKLKDSSAYIKRWIGRQPPVKEESLTDWLLYDVSEKINRVIYFPFSRHEEARQTGADWEWWFLFPDFSAKMRVQAKKIDPTKDNYASIAYTNKYGLQIEKLLHDAEEKNFIPFYAFYTSLEERLMCNQEINKDEGVFIAGGNRVYSDFIQKEKSRIMPPDILSRCVPLSCLLCCPLHDEKSRDGGFIRFLTHYYSSEIKIGNNGDPNNHENGEFRGIYRNVPGYVSSLVEHATEGVPVWWEKEFRSSIEGVNSILIYDAREKE